MAAGIEMAKETRIFRAEANEKGEHILLLRSMPSRIPLAKATELPIVFDDWTMETPPAALLAVARLMQAWADDESASDGARLVVPDDDGVILHPALAASLGENEAMSVGLPPTAKLSLAIQSHGLVHTPDFRIDARWTRPNGLPALVQVNGARLRYDNRDWRIAEPLWSIMQAANLVNAAEDEAQRFAALAELRSAIGEEFQERVHPDGYLERLRLSYAAGFSLDLQPSANGFDFDPVLFGKARLGEAEDGAVLDQEADMLLPPIQQAAFARRFRQGDGSRRAYLLDDGSLLFLDPGLKRALGIVRKAQSGSAETRRRFASNPRRAINEALASEGAPAEDAANLFVETQQFSERVSGIDIWRKPVLPWIKPKPNSWLPEKFGLRIGDPPDDDMLEIAPEQVQPMLEAVQQAVREERESFIFDGTEIPATVQTEQALGDLAALLEASQKDDAGEGSPPVATERYFLQVRENLEDVGYAPLAPTSQEERETAAFPTIMLSSPKPHQVTGFRWLADCWNAAMPGALLADDMGLGKTFQALSFLAWLRHDRSVTLPVLIVAPTGLLANWRAEIDRHVGAGQLGRLVNAYGSDLARARDGNGRDIEVGAAGINSEAWNGAGIVLTTFETMRDYHLSFARQPFAAIIYDEVQKLKNPASQMTRAAKTLNARFQLAMTGTPVENRLQDLWSIYDVVYPGMLGSSKAFETAYPASDHAQLRALHDLLVLPQGNRPPLLLRRMKDECLEGLPRKTTEAMPLSMPPTQAMAYDRVIQRAMVARGSGRRGYMLEILQQLRGVSLHPVDPDMAGSEADYFAQSARLNGLFAVLDRIKASNEKALVFCESLAMQGIVAVEIKRRYDLPHNVARIHGGITGDKRQMAVDAFQARGGGFDTMILSPKAGGVGLTLTAANHVIHLSRWWNPAVEDQATDRAYRIGQTRDVTVYLPQAVHPDLAIRSSSFDLKLDALMTRKRTLSQGLLIPGEDDADVNALFDSIVSNAVDVGGDDGKAVRLEADGAAQTVEIESEPASPEITAPATAVVPVREPRWKSPTEYRPGQERNHVIFTGPVANEHIVSLEIRDPYACAGHGNRGCVIEFVNLIRGSAARIDTVSITCWDAESADRRESSAQQGSDLDARWRQRMAGGPRLKYSPISKRQARHFHDRKVIVKTASGKVLRWGVTNGIDGVMLTTKECTIWLQDE
jgi:hypothetical protein